MEPVTVLAGFVVLAVVAAVVALLLRSRAAAKAREREALAREIAEFNASRGPTGAAKPSSAPSAARTPESAGSKPGSAVPSDEEAFRKPGVPRRDVDPLNDRSKSLQDRWDGSGRKR